MVIVVFDLIKPWNIDQILSVEREESIKKPNLARLGDLIDYKLLLLKENKRAFRITCIMLILAKLHYSMSLDV